METRKRGNEAENNENPKSKRMRRTQILRCRRTGILLTNIKNNYLFTTNYKISEFVLHVTEAFISQPPNRRGKLFR